MYFVYILLSLKDKRTYVGYTNNFKRRLTEHNRGKVNATKKKAPFKLFHLETFERSEDAKKREKWWKSGFGREQMKRLFVSETVK